MRKLFKLNAVIGRKNFLSLNEGPEKMHFKTHVASGTINPKSSSNYNDNQDILELTGKPSR